MSGALVVGGAGFIGTHLLASLAAHRTAPLVSLDVADPRTPVSGVDYRRGDVRRPLGPVLSDANLSTVDTIYNLAGLVATPGHPAHEYHETNVGGALTVCDLASAHDIRTVVFTSTMSVYPTGESVKTETSPTDPVNAYGRSKLLAEQVHRQWLERHRDNRLVVVRPAVVFGPGERGNFARLHRLISRGLFVFPGRRDTVKSCGYVGDLIDSLAFVLDLAERETTYNFAYEERLTIADIAGLVADALGRPAPRMTLPLGPMRLAARPFEVLERAGVRTGVDRARLDKLVSSTNIYPELLLKSGFTFGTTPAEGVARWVASIRDEG